MSTKDLVRQLLPRFRTWPILVTTVMGRTMLSITWATARQLNVKIPGLINGGADGGQHGPRDADGVTGQGTSSGHNVEPQSPRVDIFGNVANNAVAPGWTGEQLDPVIRRDVPGLRLRLKPGLR